jgi:hypothetical protein
VHSNDENLRTLADGGRKFKAYAKATHTDFGELGHKTQNTVSKEGWKFLLFSEMN